MSKTHTSTGEGVLVDVVRESPVDKYLMRHRRRLLLVVLLIVIALLAWCLYRYDRAEPAKGETPGYAAASRPAEPGT